MGFLELDFRSWFSVRGIESLSPAIHGRCGVNSVGEVGIENLDGMDCKLARSCHSFFNAIRRFLWPTLTAGIDPLNMSIIRRLQKTDRFLHEGFPIAVERRGPLEPFGFQSHDFCEIVIVAGAKGVHTNGENSYRVSVGDTFVIGGDRPHDYLNMDPLSLINVLFDASALSMTMSHLPRSPVITHSSRLSLLGENVTY